LSVVVTVAGTAAVAVVEEMEIRSEDPGVVVPVPPMPVPLPDPNGEVPALPPPPPQAARNDKSTAEVNHLITDIETPADRLTIERVSERRFDR